MGFLPNFLTVLRLVLVVPATVCLWQEAWTPALAVLVVAGLSDALDGALARRFDWTSRFGAIMDPIADKLLLGVTFIALTVKGVFPLWLLALVISRDLVILGGVLWLQAHFRSFPVSTLGISKASTVAQVGLITLQLIALAEISLIAKWAPLIVDPWGFLLVASLTVLSGAAYVVVGIKCLRTQRDAKSRS